MSIQLSVPAKKELKPRIMVFGVGGAGGNAVTNMINAELEGVEFVVANTDAQALAGSGADRKIQMGVNLTEGLGAGSDPEVGRKAAEESLAEISDVLQGAHMVFVTAGMGGGTGTGAASVIAAAAREQKILTVGVVTKPFEFEGKHRAKAADAGIDALAKEVDTLIIIPNQNLFRIANAQTTFAEAFGLADEVLYSGVSGITDLMVKPGLINLDFADVKSVMAEMGKAMMGTGEAEGEGRAIEAAEAAIANPLLEDVSLAGARAALISITGGSDMTLYEHDEAANLIRKAIDGEADIIVGSTLDESLNGSMRVSVVATGMEAEEARQNTPQVVDLNAMREDADSETAHMPAEDIPPPSHNLGDDVGQDMEAQATDVPAFLAEEALTPPRREPTKRTRGFLSRVLPGAKRETPTPIPSRETVQHEDTADPSIEPAVMPEQKPAIAEEKIAEENNDDFSDMVASLDGGGTEQETQSPAPQAPTMQGSGQETKQDNADIELKPIAERVKKPGRMRRAADAVTAPPQVEQTDMIASRRTETPTVVDAPAPTTMQTVADASGGFDRDQLDIPAFLRR